MNIIIWILFGAVAGFIVDYFDKSVNFSWFERIVVGIVGALVGGTLMNFFLNGTLDLTFTGNFDLISLLVAVVGAFIALFIYKQVRTGRR